jgi:lysyl-tRNA synthetase class 2
MSSHTEQEDGLDYYQIRLAKLQELKKLDLTLYPSSVTRTHRNEDLHNIYQSLQNGNVTEDKVTVCGRIMSIRNSGMFIDLYDDSGKIQIYSELKKLTEINAKILDKLDIGDFIEVTGHIRRTPRGELTINSETFNILAKALLPFPDKYHGLHDVEMRYRQRYIDLLSNPQSKATILNRSKIITTIRNTLLEKDFLEVETPMLHPIAGGAMAKPFLTHHNALDINLYLRIAPELYLKKLIIGGLSEKIFEINRCFRNEGISTRHNPEFTSLELYQAYVNYESMIEIAELIIKTVCEKVNNSLQIQFADKELNFTSGWPRKSMASLVKEKTGIDFLNIKTEKEAHEAAKKVGVNITGKESWGKTLETVFAEKVEPHLIQPIHVTFLPKDISPLAKVCPEDNRLTERFETYINGWEIANGFSELNDPVEQRERFLQQADSKKAGEEETHEMDEDFLTALNYAMPPTSGLGIGIDRLVMIMTNSTSIREVIAFPTLKPKN